MKDSSLCSRPQTKRVSPAELLSPKMKGRVGCACAVRSKKTLLPGVRTPGAPRGFRRMLQDREQGPRVGCPQARRSSALCVGTSFTVGSRVALVGAAFCFCAEALFQFGVSDSVPIAPDDPRSTRRGFRAPRGHLDGRVPTILDAGLACSSGSEPSRARGPAFRTSVSWRCPHHRATKVVAPVSCSRTQPSEICGPPSCSHCGKTHVT